MQTKIEEGLMGAENMRRAKRRRMWIGAAELALADYAYGAGTSRGPVRREMAAAVERALQAASDDEREVYRLEFVEGMSWQMACAAAHREKSMYYLIRGRLIRAVARELEA